MGAAGGAGPFSGVSMPPPPTPGLPDLPPDMVRTILGLLNAADLAAAASTCTALAHAAGEDALWQGVAQRAGWDDPLTRARLGRHADRAAAIGDAAGRAYLAAHERGAVLTWKARCWVSAGVACVECGAPTARRTLGRAPLPSLRLCHDCVEGVAVHGAGAMPAATSSCVLISEVAALAALSAGGEAAAALLSTHPFALDCPPGDPTFAPVRLYKARVVRELVAQEARRRERESLAGAAAGLASLGGGVV